MAHNCLESLRINRSKGITNGDFGKRQLKGKISFKSYTQILTGNAVHDKYGGQFQVTF